MSDPRPYYDHATHTHYVELPRPAFDALREGDPGMIDIANLADAVSNGEWIWIECGDDAALLRVTGIGAVTRPDTTQLGGTES